AMTLLRRFCADRKGKVAILFGLCVIPVMGLVGAAVDYSRAACVRTAMQAAADAAALAAARDVANQSQTQIAAYAKRVFDANFHRTDATLDSVTTTKGAKTITVAAKGTVKTTIMAILHVDEMAVGTSSEVGWGTNKIELALVLDNTGSMATSGKMPALKKAATDLLNALEKASPDKDAIKISIVPFDTQVNVGTSYRDAKWIIYDADLDRYAQTTRAAWTGCLTDRNMPADTQGDGSALYPAAKCGTGSLATIAPLTTKFDSLRKTIAAMAPSGNTNLTIGLAWGLTTLTPNAPIGGDAAAFGTKQLQKIMILLTDGDNTQNRYTSNPSSIDARARKACDEVKGKNVKLYTIRVIEGNRSLLQSCATSGDTYKEVANADELGPVFKQITNEIAGIRLTN
ncbi:MAG: pilus assembly protein TadG-related protein, partial [Variibacter sp.]